MDDQLFEPATVEDHSTPAEGTVEPVQSTTEPQQQFVFEAEVKPDTNHFAEIESPGRNPMETEAIRKIQQQEQQIANKLRQKADEEYKLKNERKEAGKKQLEEFLEKKSTETQARKAENIEKQQQARKSKDTATESTGWKKVSESVSLKQGQYKGIKSIDRMRESIINRVSDS